MIGIGPAELMVLLIVGVFMLAVPIAAVMAIVLVIRNQRSGDAGILREENRQLRAEIAALKRRPN